MKNFKKALALVLVIALAMGAGIMGTLAYLQDEDSDVNVMTLGNVDIVQHEYERAVNEDGTYKTATIDDRTSYVLQPFTQGKPLLPSALNTTTWEGWDWDGTPVRMSQVDSYGGMSVFKDAANAQDKFVTVENTGWTDAYVRTLVAIEIGSSSIDLFGLNAFLGVWTENKIGTITVDGNTFYVLEYVYNGASDVQRHLNGILPAGETTYPNLAQVYIHSKATNEDMKAIDGNGNGTLDILVLSQAVQAAGFADAQTALDTAFGKTSEKAAEWFGGENMPIPEIVTSLEDMKSALEAGAKSLVVKGVTISENPFNGHYYKDRNIDFVDCTFTANMNWMYINDATFTNCTFDCGSANAAVHYDELWGDAVFTNCHFVSGKIQIGTNKEADATVTFNDCVFDATTSTSIWSDRGIRVYSPAEFNGCEFNNRVVLAGSNGLSLTFNSCTMNGGTPVFYIDNNNGIIRGGNVPSVTIIGEISPVVKTLSDLQEALDSAVDGEVIVLGADITGDVTVTQKENVKITIDGNGKTYTGVMTVFGNGRKATAGLTIKGINFVAANGAASCIVSPDRTVNNAYSYSSNVTVEGCTFTDPDGVVNCAAVRHEDGGDSNWKIIDCVVDNTMHSLVQVNNVELDGLLIQGCKVNSKNGINLNQCTKVSIIDCEIDVKGYTVRFGVNGATVNGTFEIKDSTLKSANDDGDAVIIFRGEMSGSTLTIINTTLTGTPEFTGNANVVR